MYTYEVNLLCDGHREYNCSEILISDVAPTPDDGVAEVVKAAINLGWKRDKTKWYCVTCQEKKGMKNEKRDINR